jgi:hypothetical protein
MSNNLNSLSLHQLQRAVSIKEQIESLESELEALFGGRDSGSGVKALLKKKTRGYTISAAGRARIAAAQRARWAKVKGRKAPAAKKGKRRMSAAGRAAISRAAKARWAKYNAAKGTK